MAEFFRFLVESNLTTAAFVIGAFAIIIAIIGRVKTIIELSPGRRFTLAVFGLLLMAMSVGSYFIQGSPELVTQQPIPSIIPTTVISAGSSTRPSGVTLPPGGKFTPTQEWAWVCTGDLALIRKDGSVTNLFDELEYTGLITVFAPNSEVSVFAPYGGYCEPFSPETKELIVSTKISTMLNSPIQCQGGCSSVNIKELDANGNIVRDYWKP